MSTTHPTGTVLASFTVDEDEFVKVTQVTSGSEVEFVASRGDGRFWTFATSAEAMAVGLELAGWHHAVVEVVPHEVADLGPLGGLPHV